MRIADHILILHRALRTVVEESDGQYRETRRRPEQTADHRKHNQLTFHDLNIRRRSELASLAGIFLPIGYETNDSYRNYSHLMGAMMGDGQHPSNRRDRAQRRPSSTVLTTRAGQSREILESPM